MGRSHSKAHSRVTKVAPLENKGADTPSAGPMDFAFNQNLEEKSSSSLTRLQDRNEILNGQLPPLRETWYGRYSTAPRAMYFDIPLEQGETSIIKRHPPRRPEKLEPIDLPQVITSERLLSQQETWTRHKAKQKLEKKMQTPTYTSGKRQYLHKMQMLEMNRKRQEVQMELKKSLHREERITKQNLRDHKVKKILQSIPGNEDDDLLTTLPDETMNRGPDIVSLILTQLRMQDLLLSHRLIRTPRTQSSPASAMSFSSFVGNSQAAEFLDYQARNEYCHRKIGKMEAWFREQEARGQVLWDISSSDSDEQGNDDKKPRALVRTRTERIPLFDEFFDGE
ncbi:factor associated with metabolism and energy isoform X1 [Callospermophilus lateralis]|uniref:factor associated with metabolism and energy isoform X1 n=1 Tax=Callospermophilus lateralis TaxID=76772 RepID=UPI0040389BC8